MALTCELHGLDTLTLLVENGQTTLIVRRLLQEVGILDLELNTILLVVVHSADVSKDTTAFILLFVAFEVLVQGEQAQGGLEKVLGFLRL